MLFKGLAKALVHFCIFSNFSKSLTGLDKSAETGLLLPYLKSASFSTNILSPRKIKYKILF
jgi:hypothetical protein